MKLSIIIVTWQARQRIAECLDAVQASLKTQPAQIFVVDNASTDGTADFVSKQYPEIKLIRNKENTGFAAANNAGWKMSDSEYVLLLNDDAMVRAETIPTLVSWLDTHPEAGGATCRFDNVDSSIQRGYHRGLPTLGRMTASGLHHYLHVTTAAARDFLLLDETFQHEKPIEQAAATCLLLRRSAIEKSGGLFDEQFPIFFNDADLAHRLKDHHTPVWIVPGTSITHLRAQSTERIDPYEAKEKYYSGLFRYFKKHHRFGDYWVSKTMFIGLLGLLYTGSRLGIVSSYFGTPINDRDTSNKRQLDVIKTLLAT